MKKNKNRFAEVIGSEKEVCREVGEGDGVGVEDVDISYSR